MRSTSIEWAESGWIADVFVRQGIRRLLGSRISSEARELADQEQLAETLRNGPMLVGAEEANEQHYEVPPEFFETVLGPRLKYSCGLWSDPAATLAESETEMLRLTTTRAGLEDGMNVLDLGCGWGSLSLWIAEAFPNCRVTAVSNSKPQKAFIDQRCRERGYRNVQVITANVAEFDTSDRFDRVISVEMFEHVRNHQELLRRVASWLQQDGRLFVHIFCHRQFAYLFETEGPNNWMGRNFFTGGMMPSFDWLTRFSDHLSVDTQWQVNGEHYARTCEAWLQRLDQNRAELERLFRADLTRSEAARQLQRWRIFFMACAELFRYRKGEEWFVGHYRFKPNCG